MSSPRRLLRRNRNRRKLHLVLLPRRASSVQSTRSGLSPPNCQQIGMHIMPAGHIDNAGRRRPTFLNDPKLLDRRPSSPSLWTRQNRNLAHVCSFAGKSISKLSYARSLHGRRSSPEAYSATCGISMDPGCRLRNCEGVNCAATKSMQNSGDPLLFAIKIEGRDPGAGLQVPIPPAIVAQVRGRSGFSSSRMGCRDARARAADRCVILL
jgi:hypothetical protein